VGLHLPLPHLDPTGTSEYKLESILVLGGSSGIGAAAIQYLRLALPDATILTTSSGKHHERLLSMGATRCFERHAQDDPTDIRSSTSHGAGVDAIIDPVAAAANQPAVFAALNPNGPQLYSQIVTGQNVTVPEGVKASVLFGRQIFGTKGGMAVLQGLSELLEGGKFQLPAGVEVVGNDFEAIQPALERLMRGGVSGNKYVVSV
jgi:NADPH:quinone reductase-like Zn-dependent oxidoreductase